MSTSDLAPVKITVVQWSQSWILAGLECVLLFNCGRYKFIIIIIIISVATVVRYSTYLAIPASQDLFHIHKIQVIY